MIKPTMCLTLHPDMVREDFKEYWTVCDWKADRVRLVRYK